MCTSIDALSGADLGQWVQVWVWVGMPAHWRWHNSNGVIITIIFIMDKVGVPVGVPLVLGGEWGRWAYWVVGPVLSSFLSLLLPLHLLLWCPCVRWGQLVCCTSWLCEVVVEVEAAGGQL